MRATILKRLRQFVSYLLGLVVLASLAAIVFYWVAAFVYFGFHGTFDGLAEWSLTHVAHLGRLGLRGGPLVWTEWPSLGYHALRTCGPGIFVLPPAYLILRCFELCCPE